MDRENIILLIPLGVLMAFAGVAWIAFYFEKRKAVRLWRLLMSRGTPPTPEEFRILFPGACQECFSREIVEISGPNYQQVGNGVVADVGGADSSVCYRCGNVTNYGINNLANIIRELPDGTRLVRVRNDYLGSRADQIADIPWSAAPQS